MIDKLCAINLNYLLMKQSILIQQASLSDIEAVVRKVLDDILDDLKLRRAKILSGFLLVRRLRRCCGFLCQLWPIGQDKE